MGDNLVAKRTDAKIIDLMITTRCSLKCKLCGFGVPYVKNPCHVSLESLSKQLEKFFEVWDSTQRLNFIGGEVLMHPNIYEIVQETLKYKDKIKTFRITTNGTIPPSEKLLKLIADCNEEKNFEFVISDYGSSLSRKVDKIIECLEFYKIPYIVHKYFGKNLYYGGWVDFGNDTYIESSDEDLKNKYLNCACKKSMFQLLYDGKVFQCGYQFRLFIVKNILPNKDEYIDLFDNTISIDEKKEIVSGFYKNPLTACKYCKSLNEKLSKRYPPAEQLI